MEWQGEFKEKEVKGADVGNRLYAGKKRMFKGHKWERTLEKRTWERKMLMKDMQERIERFRTVRDPFSSFFFLAHLRVECHHSLLLLEDASVGERTCADGSRL